jgi:hypothetical protein
MPIDDFRCGSCEGLIILFPPDLCRICENPICIVCNSISRRGCYKQGLICQDCHPGKPTYCQKEGCDCLNIPPDKRRILDKRERKIEELFIEKLETLRWKETHPPINYKSVHNGKFLVDLFLSDDEFEAGYCTWLVEKATERLKDQTDEEYENFQLYRTEARELLELKETMKFTRVLRKRDKSPKRNQQTGE